MWCHDNELITQRTHADTCRSVISEKNVSGYVAVGKPNYVKTLHYQHLCFQHLCGVLFCIMI